MLTCFPGDDPAVLLAVAVAPRTLLTVPPTAPAILTCFPGDDPAVLLAVAVAPDELEVCSLEF
jgi:hypothetical protein